MSVFIPDCEVVNSFEIDGYVIKVYADGTIVVFDPDGDPVANCGSVTEAKEFVAEQIRLSGTSSMRP